MFGLYAKGIVRPVFALSVDPVLWKEQRGKVLIQVRNFWDAKTTRNADLPETHDKRKQSDQPTRCARGLAADAGRQGYYPVRFSIAAILFLANYCLASDIYLPPELNELASKNNCLPYHELYIGKGALDPPFVYGAIKGTSFYGSAAVICNNRSGVSGSGNESVYRILIWEEPFYKRRNECSAVISGNFIPGGLRILQEPKPLVDFRYLENNKQSVTEEGMTIGPIIQTGSELGSSLLYCLNGQWIVKTTYDQ